MTAPGDIGPPRGPAPAAPVTTGHAGDHQRAGLSKGSGQGATQDSAEGAKAGQRAPATMAGGGNAPLVPARLQPAGAPGPALAVLVRLLPEPDAAASGPRPGLLASVVARQPEGGLVLEVAGHRLTVPAGQIDLPLGARLALQIQPAGGAPGAPITDVDGLEQLLANLMGKAPATAAAAAAALPARADHTLAARLRGDWRLLAGPGADMGETDPSLSRQALEVRVDGESGRVVVNDRDTGWRALFGLLGGIDQPAAPLVQWRRAAGKRAREDEEERLLLTLDLSRLGRVSVDLRISTARFDAMIGSAVPLPEGLRRALGESFAAAAEIGGREASLVFRLVKPREDGEPASQLGTWLG